MEKTRVKLNICGNDYYINTDEDPKYVQELGEELDEALGRAFSENGPYLIDCKIDKDEFVLPMLPPGGSMDDIIVRIGD